VRTVLCLLCAFVMDDLISVLLLLDQIKPIEQLVPVS
jgi:hypothetical protein